MLKLEHHELRSKSEKLAQQLRELGVHEAAVDTAVEEIRSVEDIARRLVESENFLPVDALESLLRYMPEARKRLREARLTRARSEDVAAQTRKAVVRRKAKVRGVERVHERIAALRAAEIERDLARELDELWSYRRGTKS